MFKQILSNGQNKIRYFFYLNFVSIYEDDMLPFLLKPSWLVQYYFIEPMETKLEYYITL
jgi:hypothetical protein